MKNRRFSFPAFVLLAALPQLGIGQLAVSLDVAPPSCDSYSDGSIQALPSGGSPPYAFTWSNGQGGQTTYGVAAGTYAVTVTDASAATATATATVADPPLLLAAVLPVVNPCLGNAGSFLAKETGGTAPYSYLWSSGQTTPLISQPQPGYHFATITDAKGCIAVGGMEINAPLSASVHTVDVVCAALCDGSAEAVIAGGTAPYSFLWNTGATAQVIFPLPPGTFSVTVTDGWGCTVEASGSVFEPPAIVLSVDLQNPCSGDATAFAIASGGVPPFTYEWSNGTSGQQVAGLHQGVYFVTATDANGCKKDRQVTVGSGVVAVIAGSTPAACDGTSSGSATAAAPGGIGPLSFLWSGGQTGATAANLAPGTYSVTVTDGAGCTGTASATIGAGEGFLLNTASTPGGCPGGSSGLGTATVAVVSGGTAPFSFLWSNGQTSPNLSNLAPGSYTVTVMDAAGCTGTASATVEAGESMVLAASVTAGGCPGATVGTGAASVSVSSGGEAPFSYLWSNGQAAPNLFGLFPGSYGVTATDANGCQSVLSVTVPFAPSLTILVEVDDANCHNTADGGAEVVGAGGNATPPFAYLWSNGATVQAIGGLAPGSYGVTVTDAGGCTGTVPVNIFSDASLEAGFSWQTADCAGDTLDVQFQAGVNFFPPGNPVVSHEWIFNGGQQTSDLPDPLVSATGSVLEATLIVENGTGCRDTVSQNIDLQNLLSLDITGGAAGCVGDTVQLQAVVPPGASGLTYHWTTSSPSAAILGDTLPNPQVVLGDTGAHVIFLLLQNAAGCSATDSVLVTGTSASVSFDPSLVTYAQCEGLTLDFTNGNPAAGAFQWFFNFPNDPGATSTLPNPSYEYPAPGSFTVAFVPLADCVADTFFLPVEVGEAAEALFSFQKSPCSNTVSLTFADASTAPGTITDWHWQFSNGDTSDLQNPSLTLTQSQSLAATLTVEFETGCTATFTDTVDVAAFNPPFLQDTAVACQPDPSAELNPNGDPSLTYSWSPPGGLSDPNFWNPTATAGSTTAYSVTISDESGTEACSVEKEVPYFVPDALGLTAPQDVAACHDTTATLTASAAAGGSWQWSSQPDFSDTLAQAPSLDVPVTASSAEFFVKITDAYGCSESASAMAGSYGVAAQIPAKLEACQGGFLEAEIPGTTPGDTLHWQPFDPTGGQPLDDTTTFTLTITNSHGCSASGSLTVNTIDLSHLIEVHPAADTILAGESVTLEVSANFTHTCIWSPSASGGLDDPNSCDPSATPSVTTTYTVKVEDPATGYRGGGGSVITVVDPVCGEPLIFVPNAFTPNGDGLNDVLFVRGFNIPRVLVFAIYDRWGDKIFESHSLDEGWDGEFGGRLVTGDVFAYYLKVECLSGEEFFKKGNVTVLR